MTGGIQKDYPDPMSGWTRLHNDWARDPRLDWGALGLLTFLTSHKNGWEVKLTELHSARASKRFKVDAWLTQLEQYGYIRREIIREGGEVTGTRWHLLAPDTVSDVGDQHQSTGFQQGDNPVDNSPVKLDTW